MNIPEAISGLTPSLLHLRALRKSRGTVVTGTEIEASGKQMVWMVSVQELEGGLVSSGGLEFYLIPNAGDQFLNVGLFHIP